MLSAIVRFLRGEYVSGVHFGAAGDWFPADGTAEGNFWPRHFLTLTSQVFITRKSLGSHRK